MNKKKKAVPKLEKSKTMGLHKKSVSTIEPELVNLTVQQRARAVMHKEEQKQKEAKAREEQVLKERFKTSAVNNNGNESPSGISKFFSAIFFCGNNRDDGKQGSGCLSGKPPTNEAQADGKYLPSQTAPERESQDDGIFEAMQERNKRKNRRNMWEDESNSDVSDHRRSSGASSSSSSDGFKKKPVKGKGKKKVSVVKTRKQSSSSSSSVDNRQRKNVKNYPKNGISAKRQSMVSIKSKKQQAHNMSSSSDSESDQDLKELSKFKFLKNELK